jgi:two-component system copper resistance phosphate regulon response regulator CusR
LTRRRALALTPTTLRVADLEVDLGSRQVRRAGRPIDLTAKEFGLLELLLRRQDQVVDRSAITAHVWDNNHDPFANVLDVLVRRLRSKIDDGFDPKLIHTIRGAGYRLSAAG